MNDYTPERIADMIAKYRYNAVHDGLRIGRLEIENNYLRNTNENLLREIEALKKQIEANGKASA